MSTRRINEAPSFTLIDNKKELAQIEMEMKKILPKIEVSVEGLSEIATGKVIEWDVKRKLFTIRWEKKSEKFEAITESQTGLRAYFKCALFSTQLVFKTTTVRRLEDGTYHYRIPEELFKQQKRGALRVPIRPGMATLTSNEGDFEILDLSVGGAKLKVHPRYTAASSLQDCELNLNGYLLKTSFEAKITRQDEKHIACKFVGLEEEIKTQIKQFLIEALRVYYEEVL